MKTNNVRFKLNFTKFDIFFIIPVFLISLSLSFFMFFSSSDQNNLIVSVSYDRSVIYKTPLLPEKNDTDPRYIILFKGEKSSKYDDLYPTIEERKFENKNLLIDDLVIKIAEGKVSIVEETSPNHICSRQGSISNPNNPPLVCLPNYVSIKITTSNQPVNPDDIINMG